jgi:hypothetical protein
VGKNPSNGTRRAIVSSRKPGSPRNPSRGTRSPPKRGAACQRHGRALPPRNDRFPAIPNR